MVYCQQIFERLNQFFRSMLRRDMMLRARVDQADFGSCGTLKKLTQGCILKNKKFFCDLDYYQGNPFWRISNCMKKELMDLEARMQEEATDKENLLNAKMQSKLLILLLNPKITTFQFPPGLHSGNHAEVTELWKTLLEVQPPDLHTLVCKPIRCKTWDIRPFFDRLLPAFPNLEVLQLMPLECNNQDLISIAEHLPKLRVLNLTLLAEEFTIVGIVSSMHKMTSLERYFFQYK